MDDAYAPHDISENFPDTARCPPSAHGCHTLRRYSAVPMRIRSAKSPNEPVRSARFEKPSCRPNIRILARPCTPTCNVSYYRDSSPRLSCNLGRDASPQVVVVRSGRRPLFEHSVCFHAVRQWLVVNGPKFNLGMIVHSFTSRFQQNHRAIPRPRVSFRIPIASASECGVPCRPRVGSVCTPRPCAENSICHGLCRLSAPEQNKNTFAKYHLIHLPCPELFARSPGSTWSLGCVSDNVHSPSSLFSLIVQHSIKCAIILAKIVDTLTSVGTATKQKRL